MRSCRPNKIMSVMTEVLLWFIMTILTLLMSFNMVGIKPVTRGFLCNDTSIKHIYKDDTVSDTMIIIMFIVIPVVIIMITETVHVLRSKVAETKDRKQICNKLTSTFYRSVGSFLFAATCTLFLTETTKLLCGRLRPNFISVCKPNFATLNCSHGYVYVTDDMCTLDSTEKRLLDSRKSFPSGHASLAAFGAVYVIIYLHKRFTWVKHVRILLPLLQTGLIFVAIYVSVSRINDNKHHTGDVIGGAILGIITPYLLIKYTSCNKRETITDTFTLPVTSDHNSTHMLRTISVTNDRSEYNNMNN
ncbi:hypothetical protein ACF0H5_022532 [Mactra antiquata]